MTARPPSSRPSTPTIARNIRLVRLLGLIRARIYSPADMARILVLSPWTLDYERRLVLSCPDVLTSLIGREHSTDFAWWLTKHRERYQPRPATA